MSESIAPSRSTASRKVGRSAMVAAGGLVAALVVACEGNARLLMLDLQDATHPHVTATHNVGLAPDVLALDAEWRRLYVAAESGVLSVFDERGKMLVKRAEGFVAPAAHTVAVDPRSHRLSLPLQDVGGRPVLRIAAAPRPELPSP